jgi:putative membrane protein
MRAFALLLTAGVALAGCNTTPTDDAAMAPADAAMGPGGAMAGDPANPMTAAGYVPMAASSDQFEIQSSQLALQASQNPAVRSYANMMIAHHQATTATLTSVAQSAGLPPPPPTMMPKEQQMIDQLRAAGTGAAFDAAYKNAQIMGHQSALQLHQGYASGGDVPALRQAAASAVPIVQQHLTSAQSLNTDMGAMGGMNGMGQQPADGSAPSSTAPVRAGERG